MPDWRQRKKGWRKVLRILSIPSGGTINRRFNDDLFFGIDHQNADDARNCAAEIRQILSRHAAPGHLYRRIEAMFVSRN
jgi:hypothetical protein